MIDGNRSQDSRRILLTLVVALIALAGAGGCFLLSPDTGGDGPLDVVIRARVSAGDIPRAAGGCPPADGLPADVERISARAEILCSDPGTAPVCVAGEGPMRVSRVDGEVIELEGDFEVTLGPRGSTYRIVVWILEQGDGIEGSYEGTLLLDAGLLVEVERMDLSGPASDLEASIRVRSSAVNGGESLEYSSDGGEVTASFDAPSNQLTFVYESSEPVEWEGEERDGIRVTLRGGLLPVPIFVGEATLETLVPGAPADEILIELQPPARSPRVPGDLGEQVFGTLLVRFTDGPSPSESGAFRLRRIEPACR